MNNSLDQNLTDQPDNQAMASSVDSFVDLSEETQQEELNSATKLSSPLDPNLTSQPDSQAMTDSFTVDQSYEYFTNEPKSAIVEGSNAKGSFVITPKGLTFDKITDVLNKAKGGDYEEIDEIIEKLRDYEDAYVTDLDAENFKNFCLQQFDWELDDLQSNFKRSDHQYICSNILSRCKFNTDSFNHDYSVKELMLLAIAANDTLTEKYQNVLLAENNLSLLPLLVGSKKCIGIFMEKFHSIDGIYEKLKNQSIRFDEFSKIGFFSVIALREEYDLLEIDLVLNDLEEALKINDSLYGVFETASLVQNEKFITVMLDAFERRINDPAKKELLKKSFVTLLEPAVSQEHDLIVKYLCKKCTENENPEIRKIYGEELANDKIIEQIGKQVVQSIQSAKGGRKVKKQNIYNVCLNAAAYIGNVEFITRVLDLTTSDPQFASDKNRQAFFQNSLTTVLSSTKSSPVIECLLKKYSEDITRALESKEIKDQAALSVLDSAVRLVEEAAIAQDVKALSTYINIVQAAVISVPPKEGASKVNELVQILTKFHESEEFFGRSDAYPTVLFTPQLYPLVKYVTEILGGYISQEDFNKLINLEGALSKIKSDLARKDEVLATTTVNTSSQAASSDSQDLKPKGIDSKQQELVGNGENSIIGKEVPIQEPLGNNSSEGRVLDIKTADSGYDSASTSTSGQSTPVDNQAILSESIDPEVLQLMGDMVDYVVNDEQAAEHAAIQISTLYNEESEVLHAGAVNNGDLGVRIVNFPNGDEAAIEDIDENTGEPINSAIKVNTKQHNNSCAGGVTTQSPISEGQAPGPAPTTLTVNKEADRKNDTQTNVGQSIDPNNTAPQSTKFYNAASLSLLVGGSGCVALALGLYVFEVSLLATGIAAGVGLFCLALAVYCCKPKTLIKDDKVEEVVPKVAISTKG